MAYDDQDVMTLYMEEVGGHEILTREEQLHLGQMMIRGKFASTIMPKDHYHAIGLTKIIRRGEAARERLICTSLKLVIDIAKRYANRGVSLSDLIQEGNLGLMTAADRYDYTRGYKFATYATWWVRQAVGRCVADQARTIRLPVHMTDRVSKLYRLQTSIEQLKGHIEQVDMISLLAAETNLTVKQVKYALTLFEDSHMSSLDEPIADDSEEADRYALVWDDAQIEEEVALTLLSERFQDILGTLSARQAQVVMMRFGLFGEHEHTLEEAGRRFGLTRERVRQIEAVALRRLRHPRRSKHVREYV